MSSCIFVSYNNRLLKLNKMFHVTSFNHLSARKQTTKSPSANIKKKKMFQVLSYRNSKAWRANSADLDEAAHQDLRCLQIQPFSSLRLVLKVLISLRKCSIFLFTTCYHNKVGIHVFPTTRITKQIC